MGSAWGLLNLLVGKEFFRRYPHAPASFYHHPGRCPPHRLCRLATGPALPALRPQGYPDTATRLAPAGRRPVLLAGGRRPPLPLRLQARNRPPARPRQPARRAGPDRLPGRCPVPPGRVPAAQALGGRPRPALLPLL